MKRLHVSSSLLLSVGKVVTISLAWDLQTAVLPDVCYFLCTFVLPGNFFVLAVFT